MSEEFTISLTQEEGSLILNLLDNHREFLLTQLVNDKHQHDKELFKNIKKRRNKTDSLLDKINFWLSNFDDEITGIDNTNLDEETRNNFYPNK